jgi:DNA-binding MarR family transcriptional regulator
MQLDSKTRAIVKTIPKYKELTGLEKDIVLFVSRKQEGEITINKLSKSLGINQSLSSRILSGLKDDGIISKTRNEKNKKEIYISLTSLGDEVIDGLKNKDNKHALVMFL